MAGAGGTEPEPFPACRWMRPSPHGPTVKSAVTIESRWAIDGIFQIIVLRISNAIIRVKKGVDRIVEYILARESEKQPSRRSRLIIHPSARPEYRDGRWPRCS